MVLCPSFLAWGGVGEGERDGPWAECAPRNRAMGWMGEKNHNPTLRRSNMGVER